MRKIPRFQIIINKTDPERITLFSGNLHQNPHFSVIKAPILLIEKVENQSIGTKISQLSL